jgi:hypothetical protein
LRFVLIAVVTGEQKWEALSLEEKRKVLGDTRNFLLTMGSGTVPHFLLRTTRTQHAH